MDIETRIAKLHQTVDAAIEKAKRVGRPRIPGDGDGDGIPHEGRSKKPAPTKATPEQVKLMAAASGKYSSLEYARQHQVRSKKPAQVLQGPSGHYFVPPHARGSQTLREAGYKVVLDYNGKPPQ